VGTVHIVSANYSAGSTVICHTQARLHIAVNAQNAARIFWKAAVQVWKSKKKLQIVIRYNFTK
jgi:hypothetical protein